MTIHRKTGLRLTTAALAALLLAAPPAQLRAGTMEHGLVAALFGFFTLGLFAVNTAEESQQATAVYPAYYPTAFVPGPVKSKAAVYSSVPPYRPGTTASYGVEVPSRQYSGGGSGGVYAPYGGDMASHQVYVR